MTEKCPVHGTPKTKDETHSHTAYICLQCRNERRRD
jgi:hypothetical protein